MTRPVCSIEMLLLAVLIAFAPACAELPTLRDGECGNGVIEGDEQCDLSEDPELAGGRRLQCAERTDPIRACRYVCSRTDPIAPVCPIGWGCSDDGICHAASGEFDEMDDSPIEILPYHDLDLADMNGDGRLDLVGLSQTGVTVHYGRRNGSFASSFTLSLPNRSPETIIGDVDGDNAMDLVVPTAVGPIVVRGERDRTLAPILFTQVDIDDEATGTPAQIAGMRIYTMRSELECMRFPGPTTLGIVALISEGTHLDVSIPSATGETEGMPPVALRIGAGEGYVGPSSAPQTLIAIDLDAPPDGREPPGQGEPLGGTDELIFALTGDTSIRVYDQSCSGMEPGLVLRARVMLPERWTHFALPRYPGPVELSANDSLRVADVDGDGLDDLLISALSDQYVVATAVALRRSDGTFVDARIDERFIALIGDETPVGGGIIGLAAAAWPLAAGQLDATGPAEYVGPGGIFVDTDGSLRQAYRPLASPWSEAVLVDLDGDGFKDVVATHFDRSGQIEIVLTRLTFEAGNPDVPRMTFDSRVINLSGFAGDLRAGDYDGDGRADVAFLERGLLFDTTLSVLYGGPPSAPITVGSPGSIFWMWPISGLGDQYDDLVLVVRRTQLNRLTAWGLGQLFGTAGRTLLSPLPLPFDRTDDEGPFGSESTPARVLLGNGIPGDDRVDLFAVSPTRAWILEGSDDGAFDGPRRRTFPLSVAGIESDDFDPNCSFLAVGNIDPSTPTDEVLSLTGGGCIASEAPGPVGNSQPRGEGVFGPIDLITVGFTADEQPGTARMRIEGIDIGQIRSLLLVDLDHDDDRRPEVIFSYSPPEGSLSWPPEYSGVVVYWNVSAEIGGVMTSPMAPSIIPAPPDFRADAIATINADADRHSELLMLVISNDGGPRITGDVYLIDFPQPGTAVVGDDVVLGNKLRSLAVPKLLTADLDGDGIDDVVFGDGAQVRVYRGVAHSSRMR